MDIGTGIAIAGLVIVPTLGFWFALRQDSVRWYREQRAALYVDLLVEADAERNAIEQDAARAELNAIADEDPDADGPGLLAEHDARMALLGDTHLPPDQRALLGARTAAYASPIVVRCFNLLLRIGYLGVLHQQPAPLQRVAAGRAFDALEGQIRAELHHYAPRRERLAEWFRTRLQD